MPNLSELPSPEWKAALMPLTLAERRTALSYAPRRPEIDHGVLLGELEVEDWDRAAKLQAVAQAGTAIPAPAPAAASRRRATDNRQVNFRLEPELAQRLDKAAALLGLNATGLARMLTVNGVARILREQEGDTGA